MLVWDVICFFIAIMVDLISSSYGIYVDCNIGSILLPEIKLCKASFFLPFHILRVFYASLEAHAVRFVKLLTMLKASIFV